ncbi:MAG: methyltransferase domain-containing protein [Pirellulales bacterium]|nr:methyltransferase domain-containing protein [Pirellulales bacterium]
MNARFNERAATYRQAAVVQRQLADWLAEWLEEKQTLLGKSAIELGAGDGLFTQRLAPRLDRVTAIDAAPQMVSRGRGRVPHVQWRVGDAWRLDAPAVDRLYSASLLQWLPQPAQALRRWRHLVKPQGRMLHGFYTAPTLTEWAAAVSDCSPLAWRTADQWSASFRDAGWDVLRSESSTRNVRFDSSLDLLRFFHRTGAVAPRGLGAGSLRPLLDQYDRQYALPQGGVRSTWTFFRIEAAHGG